MTSQINLTVNISRSDDAHNMFFLFKPKVLNAINKIHKSKKRPHIDSILDNVIKTEASNVDKPLIISITNELMNQNIIENKKNRQGLI